MNPNRQQLLDSIKPDMKLTKAFFLKVYGYEISFPGFADEAIRALNNAGCSKAREYYDNFVAEYQREREKELKPVAAQIRKQWEADWNKLQKGSEEKRKQKEMELLDQGKKQPLTKEQVSRQIMRW